MEKLGMFLFLVFITLPSLVDLPLFDLCRKVMEIMPCPNLTARNSMERLFKFKKRSRKGSKLIIIIIFIEKHVFQIIVFDAFVVVVFFPSLVIFVDEKSKILDVHDAPAAEAMDEEEEIEVPIDLVETAVVIVETVVETVVEIVEEIVIVIVAVNETIDEVVENDEEIATITVESVDIK